MLKTLFAAAIAASVGFAVASAGSYSNAYNTLSASGRNGFVSFESDSSGYICGPMVITLNGERVLVIKDTADHKAGIAFGAGPAPVCTK